ncbi:hypothetical protein AVEN_101413-1 [Araneus ventricosus]|uniref:Uncharacterized protein n=1 Tax=Araneus ventricosus TaxID=182803 RepID=A0A4Y2PKF6_ARAVE|nr:hypothetical protein AVEN_101413-1 [Araneus ventricosus]
MLYLSCPGIQGLISWSADAGVLMTSPAMARPLPKEERTITGEGQLDHHHYYTPNQEREAAYLYGRFSSTYSWFPHVGSLVHYRVFKRGFDKTSKKCNGTWGCKSR